MAVGEFGGGFCGVVALKRFMCLRSHCGSGCFHCVVVYYGYQEKVGRNYFKSDVLMVAGVLTAHYDNVGIFNLVEVESADRELYGKQYVAYTPFVTWPELDWEAPALNGEGELVDPDGVYSSWFSKMSQHLKKSFERKVIGGVRVSSLVIQDENDKRMVFSCKLEEA